MVREAFAAMNDDDNNFDDDAVTDDDDDDDDSYNRPSSTQVSRQRRPAPRRQLPAGLQPHFNRTPSTDRGQRRRNWAEPQYQLTKPGMRDRAQRLPQQRQQPDDNMNSTSSPNSKSTPLYPHSRVQEVSSPPFSSKRSYQHQPSSRRPRRSTQRPTQRHQDPLWNPSRRPVTTARRNTLPPPQQQTAKRDVRRRALIHHRKPQHHNSPSDSSASVSNRWIRQRHRDPRDTDQTSSSNTNKNKNSVRQRQPKQNNIDSSGNRLPHDKLALNSVDQWQAYRKLHAKTRRTNDTPDSKELMTKRDVVDPGIRSVSTTDEEDNSPEVSAFDVNYVDRFRIVLLSIYLSCPNTNPHPDLM